MNKSIGRDVGLGERTVKFLGSLKLAVVIIVTIGVLSSIGTIYEARYDARTAQKLVYHSIYMYLTLILLCVTLIAVMVNRWPWKRHHTGFVLAHVGIIITLGGALLTQKYGIDGSLSFGIGEESRYIVLQDEEVNVLSYYKGASSELLHNEVVDFLVDPPTSENTMDFAVGEKTLKIVDYYPYAQESVRIVRSSGVEDGPALRFQLQNDRVSLAEWISKPKRKPFASINLGPAKIIFSDGSYDYEGGNEIIFTPIENSELLEFRIYTKSKNGLVKSGKAKAGDSIDTGWMGLTLRFLTYFPKSKKEVTFTKLERPNPTSTSAIKLVFGERVDWLGLNETIRLFSDESAYVFTYRNRLLPIPFRMKLTKFKVGRYQGTMRAASYSSEVEAEGLPGSVVISMNNPLKYHGFTFYQSSFSQDDMGKPVASILSVNHDPGRFWKYLGSALICLGTLVLFYFKRMSFKQSKRKESS